MVDSPVAIPEEPTMPQHLSYRQIADDLADRIRRGEYPLGSKIPTYKELGKLYGVSEATAYRAVSLLADRGLVVGSQGRGVYVADVLPD